MPVIKFNARSPSSWLQFNWGGLYSDIPGWIKSAIVAGAALAGTYIMQAIEAHDWGASWNSLVGAGGAIVISWLAQFLPPTKTKIVESFKS